MSRGAGAWLWGHTWSPRGGAKSRPAAGKQAGTAENAGVALPGCASDMGTPGRAQAAGMWPGRFTSSGQLYSHRPGVQMLVIRQAGSSVQPRRILCPHGKAPGLPLRPACLQLPTQRRGLSRSSTAASRPGKQPAKRQRRRGRRKPTASSARRKRRQRPSGSRRRQTARRQRHKRRRSGRQRKRRRQLRRRRPRRRQRPRRRRPRKRRPLRRRQQQHQQLRRRKVRQPRSPLLRPRAAPSLRPRLCLKVGGARKYVA